MAGSSSARSPISAHPAAPRRSRGLRADPGQQAQRQGREERGIAAGRDDHDAAGLAPIGRDLRDRLRAARAERARQARRLAHGGLQRAEQRARRLVRDDRREVEVALVDPHLLDARADLPDELPTPPASARGSARGRAARRPPSGSAGAPPPSSSPSRRRTRAPRSSPSRRRRGSRACPRRSAGRPRSSGRSSCSQAAKKASRSRWAITASWASACFAGACFTLRTAETPGAKASLPAYRTRNAVRLSGACSVATPRPLASRRTIVTSWNTPARCICSRTRLGRETGRARAARRAARADASGRAASSRPRARVPLHRADQRELEPARVAGADAQPHVRAAQRARVEPQRRPAHARTCAPDLDAAHLHRDLRRAAGARAQPERQRRRVARHPERRTAQEEATGLRGERRAVRAGGEARGGADVEHEAAGGRLAASGRGDVDAVAERHHRIEHERDRLAADRVAGNA